jgi:curved DNA-binding protein CbpA
MNEARFEPRQPKGGQYSITWQLNANTYSAEGKGLDVSSSGVGIECLTEIKAGSIVFVQNREGTVEATYEVVHCTRKGSKFHVGLELREEPQEATKAPLQRVVEEGEPDHYETLQISRQADLQTIHRVFRIMALRFHPDNPETGDVEQFLRMKRAYAVLSDPERRSQYDAILEKNRDGGPRPIFALKDFVTGVEAETNRRLGVLCLLYHKRQTSPDSPGISLLDLEREMGFPREYLSFTLWYLRAKDFVTVADNSDYALTAPGADFVEKKAMRHEIISKLLNPSMRVKPSGAGGKSRPKTTIPPPRRFLTA